jgi:putative membrane protein
MNIFFLLKAIHIIAIISWMAGLLYLPRLFVYHSNLKVKSDSDKLFQLMEKRLLRFIMNPAMIVAFITGLGLIHFIGMAGQGWLHTKILLVVLMVVFHGFLARWRKGFIQGENKNSEKFYRIMNEAPTILMILIVVLVVFKPF